MSALFLETIDRPACEAIAEVSAGTFSYFLEVLPPVLMNRNIKPGGRRYAFGFAEGCENVAANWRPLYSDKGIRHQLANLRSI
jgi:hypothetical protein